MDPTVITALIGGTATISAALIGAVAARAKDKVIKELRGEQAKEGPVKGTVTIEEVRRVKDDMVIASGKFHASKKDPNWQLLEGIGERPFEKRVKFPQPFKAPPVVVVSLTGLDVLHEKNCRIRVEARHIDRNGFSIFMTTWSDTGVYGLWVEWLAYGN